MQRTNSLKSWMDASASVIVVMSMLLAPLSTLFAPTEVKAAGGYSISQTDSALISGADISIGGIASAHPYVGGGNTTQQRVSIDWDEDNNPATTNWVDATSFSPTFGAGNDKSFEGPWTGAYTYTNSGQHTIKVLVHHGPPNGAEASESATITIVVTILVNSAPVLSSIGDKSVDELSNLSFSVSATDGDIGDTLTYTITDAPAGSTFNSSTGEFSWAPSEAQGPGSYNVTFGVNDGNGGTDSETITITVNEVNETPVAESASVSTPLDTAQMIVLGATDADIPANTLTFSIESNPTNGVLSGLNSATGNVTYTPNAAYAGSDSFTFKVNDGTTDSNTATISITVSNDAPTMSPISDKTIPEMVAYSFTPSASDPNTDPLTYTLVSGPSGASVDSSTGEFTWTPTEVQGPGVYSVTISVTDGAATDSQTFDITVEEVNVAPVANNSSVTTDEDNPANGTVTATDSDLPANTLTFTQDAGPTNGTLTFDSSGNFDYTPDTNFNGSDSFTFIVSDGSLTDTGTVTITVNPVNDAPTITLNGAASMNLVVGDTFTDPGATGNDVEDGSLTPTVDGSVDTSTPGTYTLTYTVTDTNEASVNTTRTVIVSAAPVENTEELCSDEIDNDGDEKTDFADEDCGPFAPSPTEDTEALCKDGIDNDGDSLIDLDDSDCATFVTPPTPPAPPAPTGGGNGPIVGSFPSGVVLGASTVAPGIQTQGSVLGASTQASSSCSALISSYLRMGRNNDPEEVKELQQFLNDHMNAGLPITGFFGPLTHKAVEEFQLKYAAEILDPWQPFGLSANTPTGYVYKTTQRWINKMHCASLEIPMPQLP